MLIEVFMQRLVANDFEALQCGSHKTNENTVKEGKPVECLIEKKTFHARSCEYVSPRRFDFLRLCKGVCSLSVLESIFFIGSV